MMQQSGERLFPVLSDAGGEDGKFCLGRIADRVKDAQSEHERATGSIEHGYARRRVSPSSFDEFQPVRSTRRPLVRGKKDTAVITCRDIVILRFIR